MLPAVASISGAARARLGVGCDRQLGYRRRPLLVLGGSTSASSRPIVVALMSRRAGRPLAQGRGTRVFASISPSPCAAAASPRQAAPPPTEQLPRGPSTYGPPGRSGSLASALRRLVVVLCGSGRNVCNPPRVARAATMSQSARVLLGCQTRTRETFAARSNAGVSGGRSIPAGRPGRDGPAGVALVVRRVVTDRGFGRSVWGGAQDG
jgi:hypothetical protein